MRTNLAGVPLPFTKSWLTESCALKEISILLGERQRQLRICCKLHQNALPSIEDDTTLAVSVNASILRTLGSYPTVLYLPKTLVVETLYIAIIALVLLHKCSPSLLLI